MAFHKKIIILELLAEVELFLKRTQVDKAKASLRVSSSEAAPQRKRSRTPASAMSATPVSLSIRTPRSTQPSSSKARAVSLPGPIRAIPGYTSIHFRQLVPQVRQSAHDVVDCSLIDNPSDADEGEYLKAEIRSKEELARGSMKQVFEARFNHRPYVAKRYFRLNDSKTRQKISVEANSEALKFELKRYGIAAHYLKLFFEVAADALVEVDKRIEVTDAFIAEEEDGTTWLFEPRITSAQPIKFCGTLNHAIAANTLTAKTVHAFIHFVTRRSLGTIILADVQGSTGRLARTGQDGIILFDFMTHTPQATSGPGDHGRIGINAYWSGHQCNSICDAFTANHLFDAAEEPPSDDERPAKKRRLKTSTTRSQASSKRIILSPPVLDCPIKTEYSDIEEIPQEDSVPPTLLGRISGRPPSDADGAPLSD